MLNIIYKSMILILVIILGYVMKLLGVFSKERDFSTVSNLVLYVTLPSAIMIKLNGLRFPPILLLISIFGFLCNWLYIFIAKRFGKDKEEQSFMALNINGYNIGSFALPFIAFFLEGIPILAISLFDAGSTSMVLGGNYSMAKSIKEGDAKFNLPDLLKSIAKSPTIIVYFTMVVLSLLELNLPTVIVDIAGITGAANTFLAMFLIGLALEVNLDFEYLKNVFKYLSLRYIPAIILSIGVLFVPFLSSGIKLGLSVLLLAPIAGSAPIFTGLLDGDTELSAQVNSLSIIISIILISLYLIILGI